MKEVGIRATVVTVDLLVAVVAGVLALGGAWLGSWLANRGAEDQWLRSERLAAYADFLAAINAIGQADKREAPTAEHRMILHLTGRVQLLGPASVQALVGPVGAAAFALDPADAAGVQAFAAAEQAFQVAAADALGSVTADENWFGRDLESPARSPEV